MNKEQRQVQRDLKLAEEAAEWLEKLQDGDPSLREEYADWLRESPRHVEAALKVSSLDASLQKLDPEKKIEIVRVTESDLDENVVPLSKVSDIPDAGAPQDPSEDTSLNASQANVLETASQITTSVNPRRWLMTLAACGAVLGVVVTAFWAYRSYEASRWQSYAATSTAENTYTLIDGSSLQLAPGSRVDVRYRDRERSLKLLSGEALFKVHHDTSRPFRVFANGMMVEAVGTQFTVRQRVAGATVSVIEGRVRVESSPAGSGDAVSPSPESTTPAEPVFLGAGEQARVSSAGKLEGRGKGDLTHLRTWPEHRLEFVDEPLQKIVSEFNRYNPSLQISVDESAGSIGQYFTGSFDAQDPESWLAVLERNPALQIEQNGAEVVIRRR